MISYCFVLQIGETFNPTSIDMVNSSTSPPNLLTEADLIALMEKHGIGKEQLFNIHSYNYILSHDNMPS